MAEKSRDNSPNKRDDNRLGGDDQPFLIEGKGIAKEEITESNRNSPGRKDNQVSDLDAQVRAKQDQLIDLKRKIETRQELLSKLREIGQRSKSDSTEFYFQQLNKATDEIALKDQQLNIYQDKIRDLERQVAMMRSQVAEVSKLNITVRTLEEEVEMAKQDREAMERQLSQEKEEAEFENRGLREEIAKLKETEKKLREEESDAQRRLKDTEKTRQQLQDKLEDVVKQKEKANSDIKSEAVRADKVKEELEMIKLLLDAEKKKSKEHFSSQDKLSKEVKLMEMEVKSHQENYDKLKKEMEKMIDSDRLQRGILEAELRDMRNTIHEQREKINEMESEIVELNKKKVNEVDQLELDRLRQDNANLLDELRKNMEEIIRLEEIEGLKPELESKKEEIGNLESEIKRLKSQLGEKDSEIQGQEDRREHLEEGLLQAGSHQEKLQSKIDSLQKDKRNLLERIKSNEESLKSKEDEIQRTLKSLDESRSHAKRAKGLLDKVQKEKDDLVKKLDRVLNDLTTLKKAKDEMQVLFDKMQLEFDGMKDSVSKKDEWILKQGGEMKVIAEQYSSLKRKHGDFKLETEYEYGKVVSDKNTEIMVLKEMIKSTKAMARAKDVDITRLRRKLQQQDFGTPASDEERHSMKSSMMIKPKAGTRFGLSKATIQKRRVDESLEEELEKPVFKLVKGIDEKKSVTVKKNPADIRRMMDEENRQNWGRKANAYRKPMPVVN